MAPAAEIRNATLFWLFVRFSTFTKMATRLYLADVARGGDRFAEIIAGTFDVPIRIHRPNRSQIAEMVNKGFDQKMAFRTAAYMRNKLIAKDANILIACVAANRKGGTENTILQYLAIHGESARYITV